MRTSVLSQLFNGELYPAELARPKNEDYEQEVEAMGENKELLYASFTPEQQAHYEKMAEHYYRMVDMEQTAIFEAGFKLGARIAMEVSKDMLLPLEGISVMLRTSIKKE